MSRTSRTLAVLFGALAILVVSRGAPMEAQRPAGQGVDLVNGREAVSREVLVRFRNGSGPGLLNEIRGLADSDSILPVGRLAVRRLQSRSMSAATLLQRLASHPDVLYAEPNYIIHALSEPDEPAFPQLWGLRNLGQAIRGLPGVAGADIHAVPAWDVSAGSTAQVVAVVDTGVDYTHPDLAANMWSAPSDFQVTIEGRTITCPAGTHGFNVIRLRCDPLDDHGHGTHVSGTIGATGNNGFGVVGVNWITRLMGIKFLDANGSGTTADAISAIDFAIQAKQAFSATSGANVRVLSNSWGDTDFSQALLDEINAANDADMLFVAAAGNSGISNEILPTYPASYDAPNIISVAATTNTDGLAYFSNYGAASVHLGAPGMDILSTMPGNSYGFLSGTSMATPQVSGGAALVLAQCALDTAGVKDTLLATVEPTPALASTTMTGGRLDVNSAIRSCYAVPTAPAALTAVGGNGQVTLAWTGGTGALTFNVKRSLVAGGPYAVIASGVKAKTFTDTTVVNDTTFYYVVSGRNTLGESSDSNEAAATPKVPSDLVVSALTVPAAAGAGLTISLDSTIKNQGAGTTVPTTARFYLSLNTTISADDVVLNGVQAVPALRSGETSMASVSIDLPSATAVGTYYIVVKADADNQEPETQESNNTLARLLRIGPDLAVTALTVPATAAPGEPMVVTDTVKNQGGAAAGASRTKFYLSSNALLDASDPVLAESRPVPGLPIGATSTGSTTVLIPATTATGTYYLFATADADHEVLETDELSNSAVRSLLIGGDLVVSALTVPAAAGAGTPIVVSDTVANQGAAGVPNSVTRFYLSTKFFLDSTATVLAESRAVPSLAPGATSSGSTTIVIPSTVATASYYLFAAADGDAAVQETKETNNSTSRTIKIGGDLAVTSLTVPAAAGPGSPFAVTETTTNRGAGPIGASTTRFYLSSNALLDASDTLLSGGRDVAGLIAGASSSGSTTVTIPSGVAAGTYYIFAKADADGVALETDETNNAAVRSLSIGGDLVVSALTVPAKGGAGLPLVVNDTTTNKGLGDVAASVTRFYLSSNLFLDAADPLLDNRAVTGLAAGASNSGSTTLTLPFPLAVGNYYVIALADADNTIPESQETNNTVSRSIAIGPDLKISSISSAFTIAAGSTIPVTDVVQNQGGDAAGASTTRFFLSKNAAFDATDVALDASRDVASLAAGASSSGSTAVTIPQGTSPGYYYLFAVADADGLVTETTETNNPGVRLIQITAAP